MRFLAYVLAGLFAAVGGLSLTGLIGSADPNVAANYTLLAISAVALGGRQPRRRQRRAGGGGAGGDRDLPAAGGADLLQCLDLPAADRLRPVLTMAVVMNSTRLRRAGDCLTSACSGGLRRRLLIAVLVHLAGMLLIKGFGSTFGIRAMLVLASLLGDRLDRPDPGDPARAASTCRFRS